MVASSWVKWRVKYREGIKDASQTSWDEWKYFTIDDFQSKEDIENYIVDCELDYYERCNDGYRGIDFEIIKCPPFEYLQEAIKNCEYRRMLLDQQLKKYQDLLRGNY